MLFSCKWLDLNLKLEIWSNFLSEYTGKLENGFEFDKHTTYSKSALAFTLGSGLIEGWEQGLLVFYILL